LALCGLIATLWPAWPQAAALPQQTLRVGAEVIQVEVAETPATRQRGLMGRRSLPHGHGMLFVFDETDVHCFWMKDTPLPLSIAFITAQGRIVSMADMQPYSEAAHCPSAPVRYALEMPQGWFVSAGITPGDGVGPLPLPR
jgi:uncharacterized membrane protein (UPF0127 family)